MSNSTPSSEADATLYDPPDEHAAEFDAEQEQEELDLEISTELANQLLEVARHLGLHPSIVASRAIGFICDEVELVEEDALNSGDLIQKYQSRLDMLHSAGVKQDTETDDPTDSFSWEDVEELIQEAERASEEKDGVYLGEEEETENESFTPAPDEPTASLNKDDIPTDEDDGPPDESPKADES
ncbi:MAG: hypothetical protein BRD55_02660 [Bacteroidetes bacterium SW_9_63_38]|nr:MAG: hypothetical protein BRD55_02660 [Bacteroidetes bacterium SW_9_63_38]